VKGYEEVKRETLGVKGKECEGIPLFLDPTVVWDLVECTWYRKANRFSREQGVHWDIIDDAAATSWKVSSECHSVASSFPVTFHVERLSAHVQRLETAARCGCDQWRKGPESRCTNLERG